MSECKLCLGPCSREVHGASLRLHRWWKARLDFVMLPVRLPQPQPWKVQTGSRSEPRDPLAGLGSPVIARYLIARRAVR
jgi:hypothetical protein